MGNLCRVREGRHQCHRSKHQTKHYVRRFRELGPTESPGSLWKLGDFLKRMLSCCSACSQRATQEKRHLEEIGLYDHKGLLDVWGKGCPSSLRECEAKIYCLSWKNLTCTCLQYPPCFLSRCPPDLESTEGISKRPGLGLSVGRSALSRNAATWLFQNSDTSGREAKTSRKSQGLHKHSHDSVQPIPVLPVCVLSTPPKAQECLHSGMADLIEDYLVNHMCTYTNR